MDEHFSAISEICVVEDVERMYKEFYILYLCGDEVFLKDF